MMKSVDFFIAKFATRSKKFAALAEATNISVVNENEKNFKKLLVKNKAKLINSLLEHGWGRTGKAQETILVLKKVEKTLCALTLVNL